MATVDSHCGHKSLGLGWGLILTAGETRTMENQHNDHPTLSQKTCELPGELRPQFENSALVHPGYLVKDLSFLSVEKGKAVYIQRNICVGQNRSGPGQTSTGQPSLFLWL